MTDYLASLSRWARRLLVVATALPGKLMALAAFLAVVTPELTELVREVTDGTGYDPTWLTNTITEWALRVGIWLTAAAQVVRNVTRVPAELVGLDPVRTVVTAVHPEGPGGQ